MQVIITDAWMAKSRAFHLSGAKLLLALFALSLALMLRVSWPVPLGVSRVRVRGGHIIGSLVRLVVKDEFAQRDRYLRENIEVLAKKLGEMQARCCSWSRWGSGCPRRV